MGTKTKAELIKEIKTLQRELEACQTREADWARDMEAIQAAEKEEGEQRYRALFEAVGTPIWLIDIQDGSIADYNAVAQQSYGYSPEELTGLKINDIDVKEDPEETRERLTQLVEEGGVVYETLHQMKSGEIRNIELNLRHLALDGKNYSLGVARDVTERRQVDEDTTKLVHDLGERMKELNCLYSISRLAAKQGVTLADILVGAVALLPPAFQFPEITCARIMLDGQEFKTDDFQETPWGLRSAIVIQEKQAGQVEVNYLEEMPDSDEGPFLEEERQLLDAIAGQLGRIAVRLSVQEESQENEARLRALFDGIPIPTYTWQSQGDDVVLVDHNDAAGVITEGKIIEFLGLTADEMYPHRPDIQANLDRCLKEQCSIEEEIEYEFVSTGEKKCLAVKYAFVPPDLILVHTEDITERLQAQEEAAYERELMRTLLEYTPDYVYFKDRDRRFLRMSNSFSELFKLDLKEILGKRDEDLFPPEIAIETVRDDKHVIESGTPLVNKVEGGEPIGGRTPWVLTTKLPWYDNDGEIIGLFGISKEISKLKQAEEALRYQATLIENVSDAVIITDMDFTIQSWNHSAEALYGWRAEEVIGKSMEEVVPVEYPKDDGEAVLARFQSTGVWQGEVIQKGKDGINIYVLASVTLVKSTAGKPLGVIAINRDFTRYRQAEEALLQSEEMYRDLVEKITEVIYIIDMEGVITYTSPAIESFIGLTPEQITGQPIAKFIHPQDLDRASDNIQKLMSGDSPGTNEYRILNTSGDILWIRTSSNPIMEEDRIIGLQGVMADITEIKLVEEKLEKAAALTERQRLARDLHDSVTQTLYGIDLFSNASQQALDQGKIEKASKNIRQIQDLSQNALGDMRLLIFELQPQILEEMGLAAALHERLDLVESRSGLSTNIRVVDERPLDPSVEAELYAVATEALNNTLKHSRAEQVSVILQYKKDSVCLTIRDDGIGFDRSSPDLVKGFGLRNLEERAARIGGSSSLDSSPGAGTTVKVEVTA